ncbi:hypothetical protein PILCRDRAFT_819066 [Piloderma croceum F 1598]|uniref:Protein BIG1 n=1 Tax=Piloderma croceum (strain F 1598) TaxID=765440 RepID=A0A0C3G099_PILCF|nr:hypothetical protein PILCRDRAFT_819066 [Piloderma croceum F 1598]
MAGRALSFAALIPLVLGFSDTQPFVTWSSHRSNILDLLPSKLATSAHSVSLLNSILDHDDICDYDAVVLVEQPGLHASDLRTLDPSSNLAKLLESAPSSRQFPYVRYEAAEPFTNIAESLSRRCGSQLLSLTPGGSGPAMESGSKHVVCMKMQHLKGVASNRKAAMADHESRLSNDLDAIATLFPKYLVIFTGSPSHLSTRQAPSEFDSPPPSFLGPTFAGNSTVLQEGGILKRYQILTPGLITTLLIVLFVIVPVIMLGISALASIQLPLSSEVPKGFDAQEKKVQ